jgi:NAD/NADP transhydrogenase alpha subunit
LRPLNNENQYTQLTQEDLRRFFAGQMTAAGKVPPIALFELLFFSMVASKALESGHLVAVSSPI